jgi:hypothetical protein
MARGDLVASRTQRPNERHVKDYEEEIDGMSGSDTACPIRPE